ncbi:MAG: hypothetical protein BJ554DRAFT_2870 [Olpidium bornovanus]|uniref:Uncharacterized protein n=1 Tax=Olpidium bornovanus TaxID=278681 RepID=A0A8H7ZPB6_9FUNG|nr:MAG: hypothetical protein BJ554DRAFT_2870 [Olpidium bornovanus]
MFARFFTTGFRPEFGSRRAEHDRFRVPGGPRRFCSWARQEVHGAAVTVQAKQRSSGSIPRPDIAPAFSTDKRRERRGGDAWSAGAISGSARQTSHWRGARSRLSTDVPTVPPPSRRSACHAFGFGLSPSWAQQPAARRS